MRWRLLWGLLAVYVALDVPMVRVWRSEEAVWAQAHHVSPTSPRATANYYKALYGAGRYVEAHQLMVSP